MIGALCNLNKNDFESKFIMNRLINLLYIEIYNISHGVYIVCEIRTYFPRLISLGLYTIVITYNPEPIYPELHMARAILVSVKKERYKTTRKTQNLFLF